MTNAPETSAVEVKLPNAVIEKLRDKATSAGLPLDAYIAKIAEEEVGSGGRPTRLEQEIEWLTSRTPEEIEQARREILAKSRPARPLPEGKTLSDMVEGKWPGDETDEQVHEALERLS